MCAAKSCTSQALLVCNVQTLSWFSFHGYGTVPFLFTLLIPSLLPVMFSRQYSIQIVIDIINQNVQHNIKGKLQVQMCLIIIKVFWCDFDHASSLICGNKMPTRCNRGFYCRSYCLLNMFRAPLCPSPGAQEYYTVVATCGISCCGFQVAALVWRWGLCVRFAGCCSILQTGHITLSWWA